MDGSLSKKCVFVTGAAQGIGAAMARGLAQVGANVVIADINETAAKQTADQIGANAVGLRVDVCDRSSVREALRSAISTFGPLHAMFNNAGITQVTPLMEVTEDDFRRMMDVNALGVLIGTQEAAKIMIDQGAPGSIVNTASISGKIGSDHFSHYCASKFAVVCLTQSAARALGQHKIRVNSICPGMVETDMWQTIGRSYQQRGYMENVGDALNYYAAQAVLGRTSVPEDMVGIARFLASDASSFITGQSIVVDGGVVFS